MMRQRFVLDTTAITDAHIRDKEGFANLIEQINTIDLIAEARNELLKRKNYDDKETKRN
ncbi:MAG: hypothetical protein QXJ68_05150 [Methanocellales archaeon]